MSKTILRHRLFPLYFVTVFLFAMKWLSLTTPFLVALFAYLVLERLNILKRKAIAVAMFAALCVAIFYGGFFFLKRVFYVLPTVISSALPIIVDFADAHGVTLPFEDIDSLRELLIHIVSTKLGGLASSAVVATREFVYVVIGLVVACGLFMNGKMDLSQSRDSNSNYGVICDQISTGFSSFYRSFVALMGAQIVIASINAVLTGIVVLMLDLPNPSLMIGVTFVCGLLPIVGNLISNTVLFFVAITVSIKTGVFALLFLIILHKLEYFLNGKIIGRRIQNPMWLTLICLLIGEHLLGIPGLMLAPVWLHYLKSELS